MRDYGLEPIIWDAKDVCEHQWRNYEQKVISGKGHHWQQAENGPGLIIGKTQTRFKGDTLNAQGGMNTINNAFCSLCGAWRGSLGLESDYNLYLTHLMQIMSECKRVLKKTGTMWINIGDSYAGSNTIGRSDAERLGGLPKSQVGFRDTDIPAKSLIGIPERFAIRMTDELGMIRRNTIIWKKLNCMPSSVKDRFTVDFEYVYFFVKQGDYWFKQQFEPYAPASDVRYRQALRANKSYNSKEPYKNNTPYCGTYRRGQRTVQSRDDDADGLVVGGYDPEGRNMRTVWEPTKEEYLKWAEQWYDGCYGDVFDIPTKPFKGAHFACVSADTEILTIDGWKNYKEIEWYKSSPHHILVATYNLKTKIIEYQRLSYIKEYECNELIKVGNRDLDILMTKNHRNIIKKRSGNEEVILAENIKYSDKIRVSAPIIYPENNGIGETFAELIGWIITEGHYKKGGYIEIYQNEGDKARRIDYLLDRLEIPHTRNIRNRVYNDEIKAQVEWYLKKSPLSEWCLLNIPDKKLNKFLISLPINEIKALFKGLVGGDGHIRKDDGRISFIQKNKECKDWFQILALRLGYHSIQEDKTVYLTKKTHIGIRNTNGKGKNIKLIEYKGKVWCPKTPNGTWVARRNGRIFITGNTFPETLVEPMLSAGCPEFVCRKCGKARERIQRKTGEFQRRWSKNNADGSPYNKQDSMQNVYGEVGYTDCGCDHSDGWDVGIVLDPFMGSGTVGVVAIKQNKNFIGIELNPDYIKMANKRIEQELQQLKLEL